MGSNTIIAIVVGAILVIVGFSLWPVLNGASNSLYAYFRDSCDDGNGNRFLRAYVEDPITTNLPSDPDSDTYYSNVKGGVHGGPGMALTNDGDGKCSTGIEGEGGSGLMKGAPGQPGLPATLTGTGGSALRGADVTATSGILGIDEYNADLVAYNNANVGSELAPWSDTSSFAARSATATAYLGWVEANHGFDPFVVVPGQDTVPPIADKLGTPTAFTNIFNEQGEQIAPRIASDTVGGSDGIPGEVNLVYPGRPTSGHTSGDFAQNWVFCETTIGDYSCDVNDVAIDAGGQLTAPYLVADRSSFFGGEPAVYESRPGIPGTGVVTGARVLAEPYQFVEVAPMLQRFSGINNLLLTILPVVSIAGFLGISGAKLYSYGKGTASIGSSISTSVFTLIGIVVAMVIAGPIMGSAVDANQVVVSGQYQVNGTFGNIVQLLFAMIPVVYIAGLVTLVGLQARTALMGTSGAGDG